MRAPIFLSLLFCLAGFSLSTPKASALSPIPTVSGDYCLDQAIYFIQNNFKKEFVIEEVTRTRKDKGDKNQVGITFWLETGLCEGELVFRFPIVKSYNCKNVHYFYVPDYLESVWATDQCQDLVQGIVYPTDAEIRPPRTEVSKDVQQPYEQY